jgi:hypothetical protein
MNTMLIRFGPDACFAAPAKQWPKILRSADSNDAAERAAALELLATGFAFLGKPLHKFIPKKKMSNKLVTLVDGRLSKVADPGKLEPAGDPTENERKAAEEAAQKEGEGEEKKEDGPPGGEGSFFFSFGTCSTGFSIIQANPTAPLLPQVVRIGHLRLLPHPVVAAATIHTPKLKVLSKVSKSTLTIPAMILPTLRSLTHSPSISPKSFLAVVFKRTTQLKMTSWPMTPGFLFVRAEDTSRSVHYRLNHISSPAYEIPVVQKNSPNLLMMQALNLRLSGQTLAPWSLLSSLSAPLLVWALG